MSKLIYVHDADERIVELLVRTLQENGYSPEYADAANADALHRIHADIALICHPQNSTDQLTLGTFKLDLEGVCAYNAQGEYIHFTPTEFAMLSYLMKNAHRAVSREELLPAVWGYENAGNSRVADDTAKRIRRKLTGCDVVLETVWNYGFRLRAI